MEKEVIEFFVEEGKVISSAPIEQKLAIYKLNANEVLKQISEETKEYKGMQIPVKLVIDKETKEYEIVVSTPTLSSLIKKELGIEVAKVEGEKKTVGNLKMEQVVKIAKMKMNDLLAKDLRTAVKMVVGTCVSIMGITIENKKPKEIIKEIDEGKWDNLFE